MVVQCWNGVTVGIEEKIGRWPGYEYLYFALEKNSCTVPGHEAIGWMWHGQGDYLLYCFMQADDITLKCYLIDFLNAGRKQAAHCTRKTRNPATAVDDLTREARTEPARQPHPETRPPGRGSDSRA
jgi:hypothetical protein